MIILWATVAAILLDAALTYIGMAYFGAYEMVIVFINTNPSLLWPFVGLQVLGALFLYKMSKKYPRVRYLLYIAALLHFGAVVHNAWLLWQAL
jgi:hypothetical protein